MSLKNRRLKAEGELPFKCWGTEIDPAAIQQMRNACRLPVAVAGALMPDAHVGYGLPIGGVLAAENSVIPYAVGVDIACRVKLTILDLPLQKLQHSGPRFAKVLEEETRFGVGARWKNRKEHPVMDAAWDANAVTRELKDLAWSQLGTSGSGNHFVEFGEIELFEPRNTLAPGRYLALVSHSGSRGAGNKIASHYSRLAAELHPELPKELQQLAWLSLDAEGDEYWSAMELMGCYASANHELIHAGILKALGAEALLQIENHHNFAWKEKHAGREVVVHRKGAVPAGKDVYGYIPGSMIAPGFLVQGLGEPASLNSCAHGAGRRMSRKQAQRETTWSALTQLVKEHNVELLSAGLDETPLAYKDIESVMRAQDTLVRKVAKFTPRLVKMAPAGERPED